MFEILASLSWKQGQYFYSSVPHFMLGKTLSLCMLCHTALWDFSPSADSKDLLGWFKSLEVFSLEIHKGNLLYTFPGCTDLHWKVVLHISHTLKCWIVKAKVLETKPSQLRAWLSHLLPEWPLYLIAAAFHVLSAAMHTVGPILPYGSHVA